MRLLGIKAALCASIVALAAAAPAQAQRGYYWPSSGYWGSYYSYWPSYGGAYYTYFPYTHSYYPYYSYYTYNPTTYAYTPPSYIAPQTPATAPSLTTYQPPSYVAPQTPATAPALTTYQSSYPSYAPEPTPTNTAVVRVLTAPDAQLTFNGVQVATTGPVRSFETPALQPGQNYRYDLKVRYSDNGVPVERDRVVIVTAGATTTVDLTPGALRQ
jgi:uncharacterized protein (TIGR03000 family)